MNMRHKIFLNSLVVLALIKAGTIQSKEIDLYDFQKYTSEPTKDDLTLFELCVEASSNKDRQRKVTRIGWLSEELGLECLKVMEYELRNVREYNVPKSHKEYLNTLSDELKSALNGTFIGTQFTPVFVPTTTKPVYEVIEVAGNFVISFKEETPCTDRENLPNNHVGYVIASKELAEEFANLVYTVEVAVEKAKFENPLPNVGRYDKMVFDVPSIVPTFSDVEVEFDVQGDWYNPIRTITTKPVIGFKLEGSLDGLEHRQVKSMSQSDYSMNSLMKEVIADLKVKAIGTYVIVEDVDIVEKEFSQRLKDLQENSVSTINTLASELELEVNVEVFRLEVHPAIVIREGDFVYYHRPKKYFYDLKSMVEWVKEFDEEEVKDSRAYAQAYESFKASDLPKV